MQSINIRIIIIRINKGTNKTQIEEKKLEKIVLQKIQAIAANSDAEDENNSDDDDDNDNDSESDHGEMNIDGITMRAITKEYDITRLEVALNYEHRPILILHRSRANGGLIRWFIDKQQYEQWNKKGFDVYNEKQNKLLKMLVLSVCEKKCYDWPY